MLIIISPLHEYHIIISSSHLTLSMSDLEMEVMRLFFFLVKEEMHDLNLSSYSRVNKATNNTTKKQH